MSAENFRFVAEALRIKFAWLFEPYSAVYSSLIEPLPHQISAVYEKMLPRQPLRFVLADDPGAGKTVMTGLLIKELILRRELQRCLIVCPGSLAEQWQDELRQKFQLDFALFSGKNFSDHCIAGIDKLARNKNFQAALQDTTWDLIVCDEAHKMSATLQGTKIRATRRFRLGQMLGKIARNFLLLTATPHNGKQEDFQLFMSLIDPDRFAGVKRSRRNIDVSDIMRRLVKEDLLTFDCKPLFPERIAYTVNYNLSPLEKDLYEQVTAYVVDEFNRAERLTGDKKSSVGFAMTILQRRLASSPLAIYKSLERRTQRLQELKINDANNFLDAEDLDEYEEFQNAQVEDEIAERVTSAQDNSELAQEISTLKRLTEIAKNVLKRGDDKRWRELSRLLQDNGNEREKLIIFTEHRDTLLYLQEKISALFGRDDVILTIHGGLTHKERHKIQEQFRRDENAFILVATDAAGEGINLQNAHLMINYDLSWNPNRLEQRFGRIHRIGQKNICYLWNLVAKETREGQVFYRLLEKLNEERAALGGKVFDILGKISFDNKPLRDLLIEAVRNGNNVRRLNSVLDKSFDPDKIKKLLQERALTEDTFAAENVTKITRNMERGDIHKLQPHCIEEFFTTAFRKLGGQIFYRGGGKYEITRLPKFLSTYKHICFSKKICAGAELIAPTHPLLKAVCNSIIEKFGDALRQGTIFIDDNADNKNLRGLFLIEIKITDGNARTLLNQLHFIEIAADTKKISETYAPYLDYRAPTDSERNKIFSAAKNLGKLEECARLYADKNLLQPRLEKIAADKKIYFDKLRHQVKLRLENEIRLWDNLATEHACKNDKLNSDLAMRRANEAEERLKIRLAEIDRDKNISAQTPKIIGSALIVPRSFSDNADARSATTKRLVDLRYRQHVCNVDFVRCA